MTEPLDPIIAGLNPQQAEAVLTTEGPVLILAGAGSGKTRVLTHRIAYLIKTMGVTSSSILAVTFTNKAAGEMKERVIRLLQGKDSTQSSGPELPATDGDDTPLELPTMGTFHSVCCQILRREIEHLGRASNFVIFDTLDQVSLVRSLLKELAPNTNLTPKAVLSAISKGKNDMLSEVELRNKLGGDYFADIVVSVYPRYQQALKENEALDFDDLLMLTVQLFRQHPDILAKYQNKWHYILIDEYQDTNQVQYLFTRLLAGQHQNICVVGDDDQSIYGFRGANVGNILAFEQDYPNTKVIKLEQNYRSTQIVLDAAWEVISENKNRTDKRLWTDRKDGNKIIVYEALNETDEANFVMETIKDRKQEGESLGQIAVLYRTNAQSRPIEEACVLHNIPYRLIGGVKFYERKEIKDLLAFLRFLHNGEDSLSFERIVNIPPRGIGTSSLKEFMTYAKELGSLQAALEQLDNAGARVNTRGYSAFMKFRELFYRWRESNLTKNLLELFDEIVDSTHYLDYINDGTNEAEERFENIQELRNSVATYTEYGPRHGLMVFLEEAALMTDLDKTNFNLDAITLITTHAVKGLEFSTVFLTGMEEGLFPHSRSMLDDKQMEEERRLCYVGITRAKNHLYFTQTQTRTIWGESRPSLPSRFLDDISEHLLEYSNWNDHIGEYKPEFKPSRAADDLKTSKHQSQFHEGEKVQHATFGLGRIVQIKGDELSVMFERGGLKRLLEGLAPLQPVD